MSELNTIEDAFLYIIDDLIGDFGEMKNLNMSKILADNSEPEIIDAAGRLVFPSFCDSHTHLVYAGSREIEYTDKIRGLSYEDIARRGGGILNSVKTLHETSENELFIQSMARIDEVIGLGIEHESDLVFAINFAL